MGTVPLPARCRRWCQQRMDSARHRWQPGEGLCTPQKWPPEETTICRRRDLRARLHRRRTELTRRMLSRFWTCTKLMWCVTQTSLASIRGFGMKRLRNPRISRRGATEEPGRSPAVLEATSGAHRATDHAPALPFPSPDRSLRRPEELQRKAVATACRQLGIR